MKKILGIMVLGYRIIWDRPDTNQTLFRVRKLETKETRTFLFAVLPKEKNILKLITSIKLK